MGIFKQIMFLAMISFSSLYAKTTVYNLSNVGAKPFQAITEQEFNILLEQVSKEKLAEAFAVIATEEKMDKFERMRKMVVSKFTGHFSLKELKDMVASKGLAVASISVVGEVVTSVILPTVFVALHVPFLAVISAAVPSPAYLLPTYFFFVNKRKNALLAAQMGVSVEQIKQLNQLKTTILEYAVDKKLFSLIATTLEQNQEITVLKRSWQELIFRANHGGEGQVYLDELEKIFKQYYPKQTSYLRILATSAEGDDALYGMLLLSYLQNNAQAMEDLHHLVMTRAQEAVGDNELRLVKRYLQIVEERQKSIEFRKKDLLKSIAHSAVDSAVANMAVAELAQLSEQIRQFEYRFLLFASNQLQDPQELAAQLEHFFREWGQYDGHYQQVLEKIKHLRRQSQLQPAGRSNMSPDNCILLLSELKI